MNKPSQVFCNRWHAIRLRTPANINVWRVTLDSPMAGVAGNKLAKLHIPLQRLGHQGLATFGGAFSNHLAACASAARHYRVAAIGFVRSYHHQDARLDLNSPTLACCQAQGMRLIGLSRDQYRRRHEADFIAELAARYPGYQIIGEGGTSAQGIAGASLLDFTQTPSGPATHIFCPVGSGGTLAGLANGHPKQTVIGVGCVRDKRLPQVVSQHTRHQNWQLDNQHTNKGFGQFGEAENQAMVHYLKQGMVLEPCYSAKLMLAIEHHAQQLPSDSRLVMFDSEGYQGLVGMYYRGLIEESLYQSMQEVLGEEILPSLSKATS